MSYNNTRLLLCAKTLVFHTIKTNKVIQMKTYTQIAPSVGAKVFSNQIAKFMINKTQCDKVIHERSLVPNLMKLIG